MFLRVIIIFVSLMLVGIFNYPAWAIGQTEGTSEKYLENHGHSKEIIRMINLQKERTEGNVVEVSQRESKFKKFIKNLWFEKDATLPVSDFGYSAIDSVETSKSSIPPTVKTIKTKYKQKHKKDSNEININDIKIRETE